MEKRTKRMVLLGIGVPAVAVGSASVALNVLMYEKFKQEQEKILKQIHESEDKIQKVLNNIDDHESREYNLDEYEDLVEDIEFARTSAELLRAYREYNNFIELFLMDDENDADTETEESEEFPKTSTEELADQDSVVPESDFMPNPEKETNEE